MTDKERTKTIVVGQSSELEGSIMSNILAAALDGQALVASSDDLGKYDGRTISVELVGPDADPFAALRVSLVPA